MGETFKAASPPADSTHQSPPKFMHIHGRVSAKVLKRIAKLKKNFAFSFFVFFFFSLNIGPHGSKSFKRFKRHLL